MITCEKISNTSYAVFAASGKYIGKLVLDIDGFFYYWPTLEGGSWSKGEMKAIVDKLEELNKDWEEKIEKDLRSIYQCKVCYEYLPSYEDLYDHYDEEHNKGIEI